MKISEVMTRDVRRPVRPDQTAQRGCRASCCSANAGAVAGAGGRSAARHDHRP